MICFHMSFFLCLFMVILHVNVSRVAFTETEREYEALAKHPSQKPKGSMKRWVETEANTHIYG